MNKPFDLTLAQAGAALVTRSGAAATQFETFTDLAAPPKNCAIVGGTAHFYYDDGKANPAGRYYRDSQLDLFMADVGDDAWVGIYKIGAGAAFAGAYKANSAAVDTEAAANPTWSLKVKLSGKMP